MTTITKTVRCPHCFKYHTIKIQVDEQQTFNTPKPQPTDSQVSPKSQKPFRGWGC